MAVSQISVRCDDSPGVLSRLIVAVKRLGLAYTGHHVDKAEDGQQIVLDIDGSFSPSEVEARFREIAAVRGVVFDGAANTGVAPAAGTAGTTDADFARRIAAAWPKIMPLVQALEDSVGEDDAENRLHQAGAVAGAELAASDPALSEAGTVHEAMAACATLIKPVANARTEGSDLRVDLSLFTRRFLNTMDLVYGKELPHCYFLAGLVEGYINSNRDLSTVRVKEPKCRSIGDDFCLFHADV